MDWLARSRAILAGLRAVARYRSERRRSLARGLSLLKRRTADWPSGSSKPVMAWIPGGETSLAARSQPHFDGEPLARRRVILVSVNYRLGSFGLFAHPALTSESPHHASGNQGILDQIAALKWVPDNIAGRGGDPKNVTIFGESAGSLDVSALMTSPLAKGLFGRVIGESGAVILDGDPLTFLQALSRDAKEKRNAH